jgi:hypothetical protein
MHFLGGDRADSQHAAVARRYQFFLLQVAKSFAYRSSADMEVCRELNLAEVVPRAVPA